MSIALRHQPVSLDEARAAQRRIAGTVIRTPLVRLNVDSEPGMDSRPRIGVRGRFHGNGELAEIYLKLENLQPVGSFKLRGVTNLVRQIPEAELADGIWTVSAGNTAQALAWVGRELGVAATAVVPDNAPDTKLASIERLGGRYVKAPFEEFARIFATRSYTGVSGRFIHPFSEPEVMAGNATIGLEVLEDLPDVDAVVAAYGGGGLCCGVALAIKAAKPSTKVYAAEAVTSAPLAAALDAGEPTRITYSLSFVDAIGSPIVQPEMFSLARRLLDGSLVVGLEETADAVRLLASRNRVIAEGGGAVPVAAALAGMAGNGKVVCVVSGGNIDSGRLAPILEGDLS